MSKIAFFCIPAHGHTNPTLEVVKELICQGHAVRYYSYECMKDKILSTGAEYISCDAYDFEQKLVPADGKRIAEDMAFAIEVLVNSTLAMDEALLEEIKVWKPDCIVGDSMALWGKLIAKKLGIPFVSSTTTFAFNQQSSKVMQGSLKDLFKVIIQMEKYVFVGPSIRPVTDEINKTREKLIYISMGTVNNGMLSFYENCIQALKDTEYQVILSVGNQIDKEELSALTKSKAIKADISVVPYLDQIAVLEKADVFLTHCGMNSVSEALYYEVPLVMFPQTNEQKGVAFRVDELGAGVYLSGISEKEIKETFNLVLSCVEYQKQASIISKSFKNCGGSRKAVEKILTVI